MSKVLVGCLLLLTANITGLAFASNQDGESDSESESMVGVNRGFSHMPPPFGLEQLYDPEWDCFDIQVPVYGPEGGHIGDQSHTWCSEAGGGGLLILAVVAIIWMNVDSGKKHAKERKQTCSDERLAKLNKELHNWCDQANTKCNQNTTTNCDEAKRRYNIHKECIRLRLNVTRKCWNDVADEGHDEQITNKKGAMENCLTRWNDLKCDGAIWENP